MTSSAASQSLEGIAIIGMTGRFPGAASIAEFWQNLREGKESVTFFSEEELIAAGVDPTLLARPDYVPARAILPDIAGFDAAFFGYSPREADVIDPQQRLFLECAWEAMEHAGYDPLIYRGLAGVFAGVGASTYVFDIHADRALWDLVGGYQVGLGNDKDHVATRVSYKLNLRGPSVTTQTACSSSLTAVALACDSLLSYQCDLALAGGSSIALPQTAGYRYQESGIQSPDGHCRSFDAAARGTVAGNGVGVVVLKRLADAVADGDAVQAVIKGWAVNNDGARKAGFTAPSVDGQATAIRTAQANADVAADTITYIEAHGTGTALGDPIEVAALTKAFRASTHRTQFCAIGSVKTNIGHLDAAAGVAGLIKTVLALQHQELPPSLHYEQPNPAIDFASSPFYVNSRLVPWPAGETPRRAGVSSFGVGGTNAHVILEEATSIPAAGSARPAHLLVLSAKSDAALDATSANLAAHLRQQPDLNLADVAFTLQNGRSRFPHRRALVCHDLAEAADLLAAAPPERVLSGVQELTDRPVAFLFPGQGAQYPNMGLGLYQHEPAFRAAVDRCCALLLPHLGLDVRAALFPPPGGEEDAARDLAQTALAQPALFVVEYALATLWEAWGVRPTALLGHSIGEYVAATLAGVFSLEDALALTAARGRLMQALPPGAMLAVPLAEADLRPLLGDELALAAVNGPALCVASGPAAAVQALEGRLAERGIEGVRLRTSHAFHSAAMDPILAAFRAQVGRVALHPPQLPYLANVTGTWADAAVTDPAYWVRHLRQTVRFADGVQALLRDPERVLLEVGPGTTLSTLARRHPACLPAHAVVASGRHPRDVQPDDDALLLALGQLWLAGAAVDWTALYAPERRRRVALPTYPFERERHWLDRQLGSAAPSAQRSPDRRSDVADWFSVPLWKQTSLPAGGALAPTHWLLFTDGGAVGARLAEHLHGLGHEAATVSAAGRYDRHGPRAFAIDPRSGPDYHRLLADLDLQRGQPLRVVHLWSAATGGEAFAGVPPVERALDAGFSSVLALAQALGDRPGGPVDLTVVTDRAQAATGGDLRHPEQATMFGLCKVLPQEYADLTCRSVDVVWPAGDEAAAERLAERLLAEVTTAGEPVVAYRGTRRWVQTFEPVRLPPPTARPARLREGGVYLITGGLGGVGLTLAAYLADAVRAKLVLVGRSAFPKPAAWPGWLAAHDERDKVSRVIRQLQALAAAGAEVMVASADVADRRQVEELVGRVQARFGALHGVIHAAGVAGGGVAQRKTAAMAAEVMQPKVQGTLALAHAVRDIPLDFLVLCSSLSAVIGGVGRVDYCAANAFLDAYAQRAEGQAGPFVLAINWDTWQEVGMAVEAALPADLQAWQAASIEAGIHPSEGVDVLARSLAADLPQVVVSTRDLRSRLAGLGAAPALEPGRPSSNGKGAAMSARPVRSHERGADAPPGSETERMVAELWQGALGLEQVGLHDDFFQAGGHSLLAIQLLSRLRDVYEIELSLDQFFAARTVAGLAETIDQQRAAARGALPRVAEALELVEHLTIEELEVLLGRPDATAGGEGARA